jgi:hypothetical protein
MPARLFDFKRENDDDFHLVIAEPGDRSKTMIARSQRRDVRRPRRCSSRRAWSLWIYSGACRSRGPGRNLGPRQT